MRALLNAVLVPTIAWIAARVAAWAANLWAIDAHGSLVHDPHGDREAEAINEAILGSLV